MIRVSLASSRASDTFGMLSVTMPLGKALRPFSTPIFPALWRDFFAPLPRERQDLAQIPYLDRSLRTPSERICGT